MSVMGILFENTPVLIAQHILEIRAILVSTVAPIEHVKVLPAETYMIIV